MQATFGRFSALQRAEIAEIELRRHQKPAARGFSALQRAEIAEIATEVLDKWTYDCFSALQRAEIAEMLHCVRERIPQREFQCSSTSRNC